MIFQMPDVHKKFCQLLVENIHITITFELPTEKVVANMLATRIGMRMTGFRCEKGSVCSNED